MNWVFGNIDRDSIKMPADEYFGIVREIERLTKENENLKHRNENQLNMIMDLRNEITDLKKQKEGLCELVGKTKKDCENLCAGYSELVNTNTQYVNEIQKLKRKLDAGCNTCPDMENTKKKNDELKELLEYKRSAICDLDAKLTEMKKNHEVAMNNQRETYRAELKKREDEIKRYLEERFVLRRKVDQLTKLNDELIEELAVRQNGDLIMNFTRKGCF